MKPKRNHLPFVCAFLLLSACAVGPRHTPDSKLEDNFALHEAGFAALVAQVNADDKLEMIRAEEVRYGGHVFSRNSDLLGLEHLGLSSGRWASYNEQLQRLGIAQITKGAGGVEFRVDSGTLLNGDSYKGYEYSLGPPAGHQKASLDNYRISADDKDQLGNFYVYKPLKANWYLYLFASR